MGAGVTELYKIPIIEILCMYYYMAKGRGIIKKCLEAFSCSSNCMFNRDNVPDELYDIDLRQYELTDDDIKRILKIQRKRPSKYNYRHTRPTLGNTHV